MYFIIEDIDQLSKMRPERACFIQVVSGNDRYHPILTNTSLIYYNNFSKGYIFVVDHSEGFHLEIKQIEDFINQHEKVYLLDKKYHSYFLDTSNCIDIQFININQTGRFDEFNCDTLLHRDYYLKYGEDFNTNKIIPISKHYEKCECLFNTVKNLLELETDIQKEEDLVSAYKKVESFGIKIDKDLFFKKYQPHANQYSIRGDLIYGSYNLYNITGRPTNAFNGINFLAIPKDPEFRECFIPKNDLLIEFDFDAYHLRLIARLIGFECPNESMHLVLGREYFGKQELSDEEYKKSKEITFRQLYGGVEDQYKNIEFLSALDTFIDKEWKKYNTFGGTLLSTGRLIKKSEGMNKLRLFNYIVQNLETKENVDKIQVILDYLKDKSTELILITYDSFLFDFCIEDGKETLSQIKNILQQGGMLVKHKYGKTYAF
jgi:hypothetical protein